VAGASSGHPPYGPRRVSSSSISTLGNDQAPRRPRPSMSSHAPRLGLDQSDHNSAIVVNVPATFAARTARARTASVPAPAPAPRQPPPRRLPAGVELHVERDQGAEDTPEHGTGDREAPATTQPVQLIIVQEPGRQEHHGRRRRERRRLRPSLEPEDHRVEEDP